MEGALGGDFAKVRVHTDTQAAQDAERLGASAFTIGRGVGFAAGAYQPGTPAGDALLAHELAHVSQQQDAEDEHLAGGREPDTGEAEDEAGADRAATQAVLSLHGGPAPAAAPAGILSRVRSGLRIRRCTPSLAQSMARATAQQVDWRSGHPMAPSHGDNRADPTWRPGAADHAVAYTKGTTPVVDARFAVSPFRTPRAGTTLSVRVTEGGAVRGTKNGITPAAVTDVSGLALSGLTGSSQVRSSSYTLQWEASVDGTTWTPVTTTGIHPVHWTFDTPKVAPTPTLAVAKATGYAAGAASAADAAARIRSGPRSVDGLGYDPADPIDPDPLDVYSHGVGICTDYANLLSVLARAAGLDANAVMFWGGFENHGRLVWVTLSPGLLSLKSVKPGVPGFGMPGNPAGWDFTYHAIARVAGALHDSALDRSGIDAEAVHDGLLVRLVDLAGGALPGAVRKTAYSRQVPRVDHPVAVTTHDFGPQLTTGDFGLVLPVRAPAGASSPFEVPGVSWSVTAGALPNGLALDPATGVLSGTPGARVRRRTYTFTVQTTAAGLTSTASYTIAVT